MSNKNERGKQVLYPALSARFTTILDSLELNPRQFALKIESSPQNISNYVLGYALPGGNILKQIAERWPQINVNWLLTGQGQMMNKSIAQATSVSSMTPKALPADPLPLTPTAGPLTVVPESEQVKELKETIRELREHNRLLTELLRAGIDISKLTSAGATATGSFKLDEALAVVDESRVCMYAAA
jgi:hypothetical protein